MEILDIYFMTSLNPKSDHDTLRIESLLLAQTFVKLYQNINLAEYNTPLTTLDSL